ncbi:MAG: hypothetical protein K2K89_10570 [Ruminococcus sp.]|nr:hypothetical protein [Ruminococcus sp.]
MKENKNAPDPDSLKFVSVYAKVREMNKAVDKLEELEQLITDIQCCDAAHMKTVQIEVLNAVGESSKHQIIIDGSNGHSNRLLAIALDDFHKMRTALLSEIKVLYLSNVVTKTETKATSLTVNKTAGETYEHE